MKTKWLASSRNLSQVLRRTMNRVRCSRILLPFLHIISSRMVVKQKSSRFQGHSLGRPYFPIYLYYLYGLFVPYHFSSIDNKLQMPTKASRNGPLVSFLLFADNLLLFMEGSMPQLQMASKISKDFYETLGHHINSSTSIPSQIN